MCERGVAFFTLCCHRLLIREPCKMYPVCNIKYDNGPTRIRAKCGGCRVKARMEELKLSNRALAEQYC
jgi:hypothetical protein